MAVMAPLTQRTLTWSYIEYKPQKKDQNDSGKDYFKRMTGTLTKYDESHSRFHHFTRDLGFSSVVDTHLGVDFRSVQLRDGVSQQPPGNGGDGPTDAEYLDVFLHNRHEKMQGCFWRMD